MFYDKFKFLCDSIGVSCSKAALEIGLSNATPTKWKKTGAIPDSSTLSKISSYFDVPIAFLLSHPPFDCWELINQDRKNFLYYTGINPDVLKIVFGIDTENPDATPLKYFISFLSLAVETTKFSKDGRWEVKLRPGYQRQKGPTQTGEHCPTDEDIKFALFGGGSEITDDMYNEVKNFAAFIKQRENGKKKGSM